MNEVKIMTIERFIILILLSAFLGGFLGHRAYKLNDRMVKLEESIVKCDKQMEINHDKR